MTFVSSTIRQSVACFAAIFVVATACMLQADRSAAQDSAQRIAPEVVAHRGLLLHAPENTLANFEACLNLRLAFELDVQRTQDGHLVCLHDTTVDRTTDGRGRVNDLTLDAIQKLDAGSWFSPDFAGQRVPTIDAVFARIAAHPQTLGPFAVDLKGDDPNIERDTVELARKHGVLARLLFIGRAIQHADVRRRLRAADANCHVAAVANTREELSAAIAAPDADWVYLRFVPAAEDVNMARAAGKRVFLSGPVVTGNVPEAWKQGAAAGIDGLLTDYPLECRTSLRPR